MNIVRSITWETHKWSNDYFLGPFSNFDIVMKKDCRRRYPNVPGARSYHGVFIFGVDLRSDLDKSKKNQEDDFDDPEDD